MIYVNSDLGHGPGSGDPDGVNGPWMSEREAIEGCAEPFKAHLASMGHATHETFSGPLNARVTELSAAADATVCWHWNGGAPDTLRTPYALVCVFDGEVESHHLARCILLQLAKLDPIRRCIIGTMNTGHAAGERLAPDEVVVGVKLQHLAWDAVRKSGKGPGNVLKWWPDTAPRVLLEVGFVDREEHKPLLGQLDAVGYRVAEGVMDYVAGRPRN